MGELLRPHRAADPPPTSSVEDAAQSRQDPAAAARGILLALALSSLAWIALALLVPRLW